MFSHSITLALAKKMAIFARGILKLTAKFSAYEAGQTLEFVKNREGWQGKFGRSMIHSCWQD
jgi:hypothetical protein